MDKLSILHSLQSIVGQLPARTAAEYRRELCKLGFVEIKKRDVNIQLYRHRELFDCVQENDGAPRWFLADDLRSFNEISSAEKLLLNAKDFTNETCKLVLYGWQREALASWRQNNWRGVVEAVTGAGKTRLGISAAIDEIARGGFVLVVVPSIELLCQWKKNLTEYLPQARIGLFGDGHQSTFRECDIIIATVNAARKWELLPPHSRQGLLIADECHRYGSNSNKEALDTRFKRRLGLSATYQRNDNGNEDWLTPFFGKICFTLDYARAIKDTIIAGFSVAMIGAEFTREERGEYEAESEKVCKFKRKLINDFNAPEEPFGEFMAQVSLMRQGNYGEGTFIARMFLSAFKKRQKLLAESPAKEAALMKLTTPIRAANRVLIFTETVTSAENIAKRLRINGTNARAIHSRFKLEERSQILREFGEGVFKVLVAPRILDEGVDIPEADLAIIVAASKTRRQMIQRMGRILRRKQDGRKAKFALIFIEDTSEDPKFRAHEAFLDEISEVADSVQTFRAKTSAVKIERFLR